MSILTGKIQYQPDPPKDFGYGETYKIKVKPDAGGEIITIFVKADHPDADRFDKNQKIYYKVIDGKPRFEGVEGGAIDRFMTVVAKPDGMEFNTLVELYSSIYNEIKKRLPESKKSLSRAANAIFKQVLKNK